MPLPPKRPAKPTVFLSHCSSNRRQLLALKRLLDGRAGGLIEFFLSSDDDSIAHGTIWPAEVRAALDRMSLMLIFVSTDALKSGWTYFEAGYGLHKLDTANIYCLPGTDKAALPPPFNILQNRNLHSLHDVGLLIRQINERLTSTLDENVTKQEFEGIFKRTSLGQIETGPSFEEIVESVAVKALGPHNSSEVFSRVCRSQRLPVSVVANTTDREERCSTGVRMIVDLPLLDEEEGEFVITDTIRKEGNADVVIYGDTWAKPDVWQGGKTRSLAEIQKYNAGIQKKNKAIRERNAKTLAEPRAAEFVLSPISISLPISTVDHWLNEVGIRKPIIAKIKLLDQVACESRIEAISAKIHGSPLSLREDGTLLWGDRIILGLCSDDSRSLTLTASDANVTSLSDFRLQELASILFELNILSLPNQRGSRRRR
jgi:hypothetical protein